MMSEQATEEKRNVFSKEKMQDLKTQVKMEQEEV